MFEVRKTVEATTALFVLKGRVDAVTAPQLKEAVMASLEGVKKVVFDASELDYVSSAGLRVVLSTLKALGAPGSVVVRGASDELREVFCVTGLDEYLAFE